MKPELENRPVQVSQGDTPSTLREASVMCKTNGGLWKPLKTFLQQPQWAAAINLRTPVHTVVSKLGKKLCCARFLLHGYTLFIHLKAWLPNKQQVAPCVFASLFSLDELNRKRVTLFVFIENNYPAAAQRICTALGESQFVTTWFG